MASEGLFRSGVFRRGKRGFVAGRQVSNFLIGTFALNVGAAIFGDTTGPDGNLWFTASGPNQVGKMTPEGAVTTYPLLSAHAFPTGITSGPDGNLWFLETDAENIARVTPSGSIAEYPADGVSFFGIITGPDGNLWFPYLYANGCACSAIGRITLNTCLFICSEAVLERMHTTGLSL
jgi:streptogramin lyase